MKKRIKAGDKVEIVFNNNYAPYGGLIGVVETNDDGYISLDFWVEGQPKSETYGLRHSLRLLCRTCGEKDCPTWTEEIKCSE